MRRVMRDDNARAGNDREILRLTEVLRTCAGWSSDRAIVAHVPDRDYCRTTSGR